MSPEQLSHMLYVSIPTIYRDLREMSKRNLIIYANGRVQQTSDDTVTTPLDFRESVHAEEKAAIAAAAAKLIRDNSAIFIDASTTAANLIVHLQQFENLIVLTNGLVTAMSLKQVGVRTYCVGGALVENSLAVGGRIASEMVNQFQIDTMLFSAYGVNDKGIIIDPSEEETNLRRHILGMAKTSVFLCDKSKFGKNSLFNVAPLSDVDYLITDGEMKPTKELVRKKTIIV